MGSRSLPRTDKYVLTASSMVLDVVESQTRACGHDCEREKRVGGADKTKPDSRCES